MRRPAWCVARILACAGIALFAQGLGAQTPAKRFWVSAGAGYGKSGPAQSLGQDQFTGPTGDVALGATLTSRGLIGIEAASWHKDTPLGSSRSLFVSLTLLGYPFGSVLDNLYFQGGLGVANASMPQTTTSGTPSRLDVKRPSLLVGLGYDIPIACPLWITPFFESYGSIGGRRYTGPQAPGVRASANAVLYHAGLSLRYVHPGPAGNCRQRGPAMTQQ
jgi:hypothetical protein